MLQQKQLHFQEFPLGLANVRVETTEALPSACGVIRLDHLVRVVTAPQVPDYIRIADPNGVNPITEIIPNQTTAPTIGQDGNIYNAQLYSCEPALNTAPAPVTFSSML